MTSRINRLLFMGAILIIAGGIILTAWSVQNEDTRLRQDLLTKSRLVKEGFSTGQILALTGSPDDLATAGYRSVKDELLRIRLADPPIRFIYFMAEQPDGTIVFLADSEPEDSEDYSPPGETYPEASATLRSAFASGVETTEGPVADRWGTWVSSISPVTDPSTGSVIAIFGMDVDARDWNLRLATAALPPVAATLILVLLLLVFSYIQQRNEREQEILRESEHRLNGIINFLPDAMFVIDRRGSVITWNRAIEEMTGVKAADMVGKGDYEYALPFYHERRPILINLVLEPDNHTALKYTGGIHRQGDLLITETDTELIRPDGTRAFLAARASPLRDVQGNVVGAIESIRDVTHRKKAELDLKQSEERNRLLVQNINDGILVHGLSESGSGQILDANEQAAQILGYTRDELLRMSMTDLDVPEEKAKFGRIVEEIRSRGHIMFETEYLRRNGHRIPVEINARLFERDGAPAVLAIVRDITERKLLEHEMELHTTEMQQYMQTLQQVNDKLNLMNRITRHDILNQLTAILGYLDLMRETFPDPRLQEYVTIQIRAANNIRDQILFTKAYQDIGSQAPRWFDLAGVISAAAEKLTLSGITLSLEVDRAEIQADPLLEKVFYTLLENTIRHGERVTSVRFSCHQEPEGLRIVYEDNGTGVPPEHKEDIFDKKFFKHTGFGLFLSRTILGITGITIRETGTFGAGARFEILVPRGAYRFRPAQ